VAQSWFKRFQSGNFYVKDASRSGCQSLEKSIKSWKKLSKIGTDSHDISKKLNIDYKTVLNHLEKAEYKKKMFGYHMI